MLDNIMAALFFGEDSSPKKIETKQGGRSVGNSGHN